MRLSTSTIFDFQISDVSRALVLPVGFRQRGVVHGIKWVCVAIMQSLQSRIEKSFSYSISYSYSNLKSPIETPENKLFLHTCSFYTLINHGALINQNMSKVLSTF